MKDIKINWSNFDLPEGKKGVIAVLMYFGKGDPRAALDAAVSEMVEGGEGYFELMEANHNNPWTRVLMTNVNDMPQYNFDAETHNLEKLLSNAS